MKLSLALLLLPLATASPILSTLLSNPLFARAPTCQTCKPQPGANICNPTTSCVPINSRTYCACRGGYRATTGANPGDTSVQWRLNTPGQAGRVFVAPGVNCDTLCNHWELGAQGCQEVSLRGDC